MPHPTFTAPDLTRFLSLNELGLEATSQLLTVAEPVISCRVRQADQWRHHCRKAGIPRGTVLRLLAQASFGHRPTRLHIRVCRYKCPDCGCLWRQDTTDADNPREKISRGGLAWALAGVVIDHLSMSRVAAGLVVSWSCANGAVFHEGLRRLISDPTRFERVKVIGADKHVWRNTRRGPHYFTVVIDLTPVQAGTGPARLLDMVEGRSKAVLKDWLAARPED